MVLSHPILITLSKHACVYLEGQGISCPEINVSSGQVQHLKPSEA